MLPLFVYGTLRDADVLGLVLGRAVDAATLQPASAPGYWVVQFPGRSYPAIVAAPGEVAAGTLVEGLDAGDRMALDAFEGSEYVRRGIEIIVNGALRQAGVYWPTIAIGADAAPWRFEDWVRRYKREFLAAEAQSTAEWRMRLSSLLLR